MRKFRLFFAAGALYELIRFGFLYFLTAMTLASVADQLSSVMLVMIGVPNLLFFAGFFLLTLFPERYKPVSPLLALGKIAGLFPLLLLLLNNWGILTFSSSSRYVENMGLNLLIIILLDFLFLLFLVSYNRRNRAREESENKHRHSVSDDNLPDVNELKVEE